MSLYVIVNQCAEKKEIHFGPLVPNDMQGLPAKQQTHIRRIAAKHPAPGASLKETRNELWQNTL